MDLTILIADDDSVYRRLICDVVKKQGYSVVEAADGCEAIDLFFARTDINLVILDVMMPKYNGWEVLKEIRERSDVPILMLTALGDEQNEVKGLSIGANDYISKPFSYEIFVARINSLLRKEKKELAENISIGKLYIEKSSHGVFVDGQKITLNNKEYSLLLYFIKNKDIVLSREKIIDNVWGYDFEGDLRTIDAHVKMLRAKLLSCSDYIKTARGSGYVFEVDS